MISNSYLPTITKPTRVTTHSATLIDHIFIKYNQSNSYTAGSIEADISDHYPNFIFFHKVKSAKINIPKFVIRRKFNERYINNLNRVLRTTDWSNVKNACTNGDPTEACNQFVESYLNKFNEEIPINTNTNLNLG